jgi:hypothetical protein
VQELSSPVLWAGLGCQVPCWELQEGRLEEGVDGRHGEWEPEELWAQGQAVAVSAVPHWQARSRPLGTLPSSEMGPAIPPHPPWLQAESWWVVPFVSAPRLQPHWPEWVGISRGFSSLAACCLG